MDEKKRKIILLAGGAIALLILGIILFALVGGDETSSVPPPVAEPEAAETTEQSGASKEEATAAKGPAKKAASVKAEGRTTLEALAARPDVYGDGTKWWALFKANPQAVRYLFENSSGKWVALVAAGTEVKVPPSPAPVSAGEQSELSKGFGVFTVQFGSYQSPTEADELLSRLKEGEPAADLYISPARVDGQDFTRVRAGLYSRWDDAEDYGKAVDAKYGEVSDYYVTQVSSREADQRNRELEKLYAKSK